MTQTHSVIQTRPLLALIMLVAISTTACSSSDDDGVDGGNGGNDTPGADVVPGAVSRTSLGDVMVYGDARRTLYTFGNDSIGKSNCNDSCALDWPPITATAAASNGDFSTITRDDSTLQWAFKGWPLYYYGGDTGDGDVNGEGLDSWYVARLNPVTTGTTSLGDVLTGSGTINNGGGDAAARTDYNGYTLYTFDSDASGVSVCNGNCAVAWPPLFADKGAVGASGFTLITRDDASVQWALNGQALYFYQGDSAPGDTTGDGVNGLWRVATPVTP